MIVADATLVVRGGGTARMGGDSAITVLDNVILNGYF